MFGIDPTMRRNAFAIVVALLSLAFIPAVGPFVMGILNYSMAGITVGLIVGIIGLYIAYLLYQRRI